MTDNITQQLNEIDPKGVHEKTAKSTWRVVVEALLIALVIRTFIFQPFTIPSGSMKPNLLIGDYVVVNKWSYGYSRWSCPFGACPFSGRLFGSAPERGDVAVFSNPGEGRYQDRAYVKRVVGVPGETIAFENGVLIIDGAPVVLESALPYPENTSDHRAEAASSPALCLRVDEGICYINQEIETFPEGISHTNFNSVDGGRYDTTEPITLGEDEFFMVGDNRDNSNDSRADVGVVPLERFIGKASVVLFSSSGSSVLQFWNWRSDRFFKSVK